MYSKFIICLSIGIIGLIINTESKSTPVILTTKGPVQGEVLNTAINSVLYSSFKGIPYAEPPLGYLRFKPPIEKKPWSNILPTVIEGANCPQKDFVYTTEYTGSEDCLYLNVYTPKLQFNDTASDLLPVMVWIYGGSFKSGYGNSSLYGPDYIIEENVVLVTFNYRLGPLGFLNLNHDNATGNAALKDQNLVLRWVNANIEKFGGNPKDVTLFGQSAGGVAVDLHVLSSLSQGLFHRAISMSASPLCPWAFQTPEASVSQAFDLGRRLGKTTKSADELLKTLYNTSAIEMMKITNDMGFVNPPFQPTIESTTVAQDQEKFLTECPYAKYLSDQFSKISYITGFTSNETLLFAETAEKFLDAVTFATNVVKSAPSKIPIPLPGSKKILGVLTKEVKSLSNFAVDEVIKETSDVIFVAGIDYKRKLLQERSGHPVYLYRFAYQSDDSLHKQLYNIDINGNIRFCNPTPEGGNDTLLQGLTWSITKKHNSYLEIEKNLSIQQDFPKHVTTNLVEAADVVILPLQTGCIGDFAKKIINVKPFTDEVKSIGSTIKNTSQAIFSKIPIIG
ncbi:venom carboxylesterase-6 [Nasonia vitripennis]|uniref:Carboxylic ester hydrolase n=1 Tax=Nasonia vitripennis TaxID=7425 RepID=A0A7M7TEJ3_NASVI|nr:venom carboxylesterase-6 [Nasonia vitripennis]